ncbi:MAG: hypothetical protein ACUVSL_18520, partial [Chloroflexus sp.]
MYGTTVLGGERGGEWGVGSGEWGVGSGEWGVGSGGGLGWGCALTSPPDPAPLPWCYALPTTGVNHVRISGYDRYGCCFERLTRWQCVAPAVLSRAGWIALPVRH